jgi:hypothetical protein
VATTQRPTKVTFAECATLVSAASWSIAPTTAEATRSPSAPLRIPIFGAFINGGAVVTSSEREFFYQQR